VIRLGLRNPNKQTNKLPPHPPKTRSWTPSHPLTFPTQAALARLTPSPAGSPARSPRPPTLPPPHLLPPPTPLPRRCYATRSSCTWPVTQLGLPCHPLTLPPAQMGLNVLQITLNNHLRYLEATLLQFLGLLPPSTSPLPIDLTPTCPCAQPM